MCIFDSIESFEEERTLRFKMPQGKGVLMDYR